MHHKNLKLREQFEAQAMGQARASDLFLGVTIHVNGYTVSGHATVRRHCTPRHCTQAVVACSRGVCRCLGLRDIVCAPLCAPLCTWMRRFLCRLLSLHMRVPS